MVFVALLLLGPVDPAAGIGAVLLARALMPSCSPDLRGRYGMQGFMATRWWSDGFVSDDQRGRSEPLRGGAG